jgi:archaellum biogenesis protein FlaJ (TadC family)
VGYLCSLFTLKTSQLRAKRRLTASTFAGLTTVMHGVVAVLMMFVYSIVRNFSIALAKMAPTSTEATQGNALALSMAQFSPADLQVLFLLTVVMVFMLAIISSAATILADGGFRLKIFMYLAIMMFISGIAFLVVPTLVSGILKVK